jgi:hypothetical protein
LEPIPEEAIKSYFGWFLSGKSEYFRWDLGEELFREVEADTRLLSLARNPLMLRLMGEVAWENPKSSLPKNRAQLFERFVQVMPRTRDEEGLRPAIAIYKVKEALSRLGFEMQQRGLVTANLGEIHDWMPDIGDEFDLALQQAQGWRFLESHGGRGIDVEFIHPLFIESFAATFLVKQLKSRTSPTEVLRDYFQNPKWREVALMVVGISDREEEILEYLCAQVEKTHNPELALTIETALSIAVEKSQANLDLAQKVKSSMLQSYLSVVNHSPNLQRIYDPVIPEGGVDDWQMFSGQLDDIKSLIANYGLEALSPVWEMFLSSNEHRSRCAATIPGSMEHPAVEPLLNLIEADETPPEMLCKAIKVLEAIGDWRPSLREAAKRRQNSQLYDEQQKEEAARRASGWHSVQGRAGTRAQLHQREIEEEHAKKVELEKHDEPLGLWARRINDIVSALGRENSRVRVAALDAIGKLNTPRFEKGEHPFDNVIEAATDVDGEVRSRAIHILGMWAWDANYSEWIDTGLLFTTFKKASEDEDERVWGTALHALGRLEGLKATTLLISYLRHPDPSVRLTIIRVLQDRLEKLALPELERVAREDHAEVVMYDFGPLHSYVQKPSEMASEAVKVIRRAMERED